MCLSFADIISHSLSNFQHNLKVSHVHSVAPHHQLGHFGFLLTFLSLILKDQYDLFILFLPYYWYYYLLE